MLLNAQNTKSHFAVKVVNAVFAQNILCKDIYSCKLSPSVPLIKAMNQIYDLSMFIYFKGVYALKFPLNRIWEITDYCLLGIFLRIMYSKINKSK